MNTPKTILELIDTPRITDVDSLEEISEGSVEVRGLKKEKTSLEPGKYTYVDFSDSTFIDLTANNVSATRSTVIRCTLKNAQFTGLQFPEGHFKDVIFENCRLTLSNFRNSTFEQCMFIGCDLTEADFGMSKLNSVAFESCIVDQADFSNCVNKRVEFSETPLYAVKGIAGLKGATISNQNLIEVAPLLASEFDLTIK
jgi:uncharacterized protein YjbI with pentapeptide repeats